MNKVSVIMPVYNAEQTLRRSVESVLRQTYREIELIIVDDGSTDRSAEILEELQKKDGRIIVIHQMNAGVSAARNTALKYATGEYVSFIDSDDAYQHSFIERMLDALITTDGQVVVCGFEDTCGNRFSYANRCYHHFCEMADEIQKISDAGYLNNVWNKMYLRSRIIHAFPEDISLGEDQLFNVWNLQNCEEIILISECLYCYHTEKNRVSLSTQYKKNAFEEAVRVHDALRIAFPTHEAFLARTFWRDYKRCILRITMNPSLGYTYKRDTVAGWRMNRSVQWLEKNLDLVPGIDKYIFRLSQYRLIYGYCHLKSWLHNITKK